MNENQNLPEAIREIRNLAQQACGAAKIEMITVTDSRGSQVQVPVAITPTINGGVNTVALLSVLKEGADLASARRLEVASGPDTRDGTALHQTLKSFVDHALRFRSKNTVIWADEDARQLSAIFDYHPAGTEGTGWQRHRSVYTCPLSEPWQAWGAGAPLKLTQDELATLLDTRDRDLASGNIAGKRAPEPAWMLTFVQSLESTGEAKAKVSRDPNTHQRKISYTREAAFVGDVVPPRAFLINVPVFQGMDSEPKEVRLRAEVNSNGEASFELRIHDADAVLREAFEDLCTSVQAQTDVPLFAGRPEGTTLCDNCAEDL